MRQAVAGEELTRPWIGIVYVAVDRNLADENDLPIDYGAWISPETADGCATDRRRTARRRRPASCRATSSPPSTAGESTRRRASTTSSACTSPGDRLTLSVLRDGQTIDVEVDARDAAGRGLD